MVYKSRADVISMGLSLVCIIHCLFLPIFLSTLPFLGFELLENKLIETGIIFLSALIGGYAIKRGFFRFHKNGLVIGLFVTGLSLMVLGNFLSISGEVVFKLSGTSLIVSAHIQNWRLSRKWSVANQNNSGIAFAE